MTQEEKRLLFKDLCARLPYGVRVCVDESGLFIPTLTYIEGEIICHFKECAWTRYIDTIKPYLRPMSSMTDVEFFIYKNTSFVNKLGFCLRGHWDFHELIPKGLALEAPKDMYNI